MKRFVFPLLVLVAPPGVAWSEECPSSPDHTESISAVIAQIQDVGNEAEAQTFSNQLWEFWTDAPDAVAQAVLDRGMTRRSGWDLRGAIEEFDKLIEYCPHYAEGYNQRAFAYYLSQDFASALPDLDKAIELSPNHVAAISGRALTLLGLHRIDEARAALSHALELNPWLSERHLMAPGGPLEPPGKDI